MRRFLAIWVILPSLTYAQIGGQLDFQALNVVSNPRSAALAGSTLSLADGDNSQFFENPAVLDSVQSGDIFFHLNPFFADVSIFSVAYTFDVNKIKGLTLGLQYLNFGSFEMTDDSGVELGTFNASDYVFSLGKAHQLGPFTLGLNLKYVNSTIDVYSASAVAFDIGGIFRVNDNWTVGMVLENAGVALSKNGFSDPSVPFDVKLGTTFKPEYMPLRFTITSGNLVNENLSLNEDSSGRSNSEIDDLMRRINFGAELLLSDNFHFLFGYNHKRKQELRLANTSGGAGFSYGLMLRIKRFQLRFSRATFHAAGGTSFLSIQTNLKDFKKIL